MSNNTISPQAAQKTNRLDFLFNAGFEMVSTVPCLSRYYMNEFHNSLTEYEFTAQKNIEQLSCKSCGQIRIPGLTSRVEIKSKKRIDKKKRQNRIQTTCLACCRTNMYHGSYKKKLPQVTTQSNPVVTIVTDKKKKNKGKKNNLKAMLSKSTEQAKPSSLNDFLSFL